MEGFNSLVLELSCKAVVGKALSAHDGNAFTLAGNGVTAELRAASLHKISDLNVESVSAFIDKGEAEIFFT